MRRGETLALRWTDVDLDAGTVAVLSSLQRVGNQLQRVPTKTHGSLQTIPLPTPCMEALISGRSACRAPDLGQGFPGQAPQGRWIIDKSCTLGVLWHPVDLVQPDHTATREAARCRG